MDINIISFFGNLGPELDILARFLTDLPGNY
jgi:hypothetical protein